MRTQLRAVEADLRPRIPTKPWSAAWLALFVALIFIPARFGGMTDVSAITLKSAQSAFERREATARPAAITVTNTNDSGPGSLRQAIIDVTPGDTIDFSASVRGVISLAGELIINKNLSLQGPGASLLSVSGDGASRVFTIGNSATNVVISGLTITDGNANDGGGIQNNGVLSVLDCYISGNQAGGNGGGGILNNGVLTVNQSTIVDNFSTFTGGGICQISRGSMTVLNSTINGNFANQDGGGVTNQGAGGAATFNCTNCTISGNTTGTLGGSGVLNIANGSAATTNLLNCTIVNNASVSGSGLANFGGPATLIIKNTIVAYNTGGPQFSNSGSLTSLGNNLYSDNSLPPASGDKPSTDPLIAPLADNGGPTMTHALHKLSQAIDAGGSSSALVDQRGLSRVDDGDGDNTSAVDIGAFEVQKYSVTNTADIGAGSLRQAITDNNGAGGGLIAFNIPGSGVQTIAPASALPAVTRAVNIDGFTQPGSRQNSLASGSDAVLLIELRGDSASVADGLTISAAYSFVSGLVINRFTNGVLLGGSRVNNVWIQGNYIGTDATGMSARPNTLAGVNLINIKPNDFVTDNLIGGQFPNHRNVISGNDGVGVFLQSANTTNNLVMGNYIGVAADGVTALGTTPARNPDPNKNNPGIGVVVGFGASHNTVGGPFPGNGNVIAFNANAGVALVGASVGNSIWGNSTYSNGGLGIDLGADGITSNDTGDGDTGPNNLQNFPVLSSVSNGAVTGSINSAPNTSFRIEFFASSDCDPLGNGEGEIFLGSQGIATGSNGNASINFPFTPVAVKPFITATATGFAAGFATSETSEFSKCISALIPEVKQVVFLPDKLLLFGSNFDGGARVFIDNTPFADPPKVDNHELLTQTGPLYSGETISEAIQPGKQVQIRIVNGGGGETTVPFTRSRSLTDRRGVRRPPLLLTSVVLAAGQVTIEGRVSAAPSITFDLYFFYTPPKGEPIPPGSCPDPNDPNKILLVNLISGQTKGLMTDDMGNYPPADKPPFKVTFADPAIVRSGYVSALAIPANSATPLQSNCLSPSPPPGPVIMQISVEIDRENPERDRIVVLGFGFVAPVRVLIDGVEFENDDSTTVTPSPTFGSQLTRSGLLKGKKAIRDAIPIGVTARLTFTNINGGSTTVDFRR
ncbi:MAG: choice-of-anchor Q domain-containing protein [Blastocatellales bacterium]